MRLTKLKYGMAACFIAASVMVGGAVTSAKAAIIDLGFAVDGSGSIGSSNFNTVKAALANALGVIPLAGQNTYRVSVVQFGSSVSNVFTTVINTASDLTSLQSAVATMSYMSGGSTCISCATTALTSNINSLGGFGDLSLMNIMTDGAPNVGITNGTTLQGTLTTAGWDSISAEAVGSFNLSFLQALVSPNPGVTTADPNALPNPLTSGFVLTVANFDAYEAAITAKIQKIVDTTTPIPVPAALPLLLGGLGGLWLASRRRMAA